MSTGTLSETTVSNTVSLQTTAFCSDNHLCLVSHLFGNSVAVNIHLKSIVQVDRLGDTEVFVINPYTKR